MDLEEIKKALVGRSLLTVSRETGINRTTLHNIKTGQHTNPTLETMQKLAGYLAPKHPSAKQ